MPAIMIHLKHVAVWGLVLIGLGACTAPSAPGSITETRWGEADGQPVFLYSLQNRNGLTARVTSYGTLLTEMHVPDRSGEFKDVVQGFDNLESYLKGHPAFGANVGRVANRIAGGKFELDGKTYELQRNAGAHHIHGGSKGFSKRVWQARPRFAPEGPQVVFEYLSPDGEEGYPGTVQAKIIYTLRHDDTLQIDYHASTDRPTLLNLAHHSYWNLAGHDAAPVFDHQLQIPAAFYLPSDNTGLPTGAIDPVEGTPYDFRVLRPLGKEMASLPRGGYDHCYTVEGEVGKLRLMARLRDPVSGRTMEVFSTQPGMQLYTGNGLNGKLSGKGVAYERFSGLCLETQHFPDAIHHEGEKGWDSIILRPARPYEHRVEYRFRAE